MQECIDHLVAFCGNDPSRTRGAIRRFITHETVLQALIDRCPCASDIAYPCVLEEYKADAIADAKEYEAKRKEMKEIKKLRSMSPEEREQYEEQRKQQMVQQEEEQGERNREFMREQQERWASGGVYKKVLSTEAANKKEEAYIKLLPPHLRELYMKKKRGEE